MPCALQSATCCILLDGQDRSQHIRVLLVLIRHHVHWKLQHSDSAVGQTVGLWKLYVRGIQHNRNEQISAFFAAAG